MSYRRSKRDRVLVVDDDASLAEMLTIVLEAEGLTTLVCRSGDEVMTAFGAFKPDVVLLDLMLPGMDGMKVCRQIRAGSAVPIIMLTAKSDTPDVVRGLEAGADDYITKPFKNTELVARVRARLRRTDAVGEVLEFGDIVLDPAAHTVSRKGRPLDLTPLEFDLLACLLGNPEQVFTREVLLERVWGYHHPGDTKLVNVHMTRLRSKIEDDAESPEVIRTVRGVGYQAIAP
ncbi:MULTISPECIES: MtrAB system response regulator MtrA [unclassified Aeromicrobium]|uniref:MtrAB system response regulator MtrA n=1 Tax=unclassified Aeromicrobium TaxID=2633570 RepID=UPI0006F97942|nr:MULTISPECIES: MtrAB system response regulator MtrA [unclassified Aeromicrobium]KQO41901.1 two-component system response regulator [Aeromicrobium sp. Leaf245]KQP27211.1 two-component system response regulator [Aeromicrobium sp. Leaf272]KQP77252.1 two-component system response regulator [Aeromicrobium sp. Leaf289]KQP81266.1 two-component system response regulator [Aeromicrobium sp. Leaf291]